MRESTHLSIKKAAGKNSRSAAIYLPRPTSVTSSHGALDFHWSKARRYSPPASLLSQFLALGDGEQILQFAKTYGPLHREDRHVLEQVSDWQGWVGVARAIVRCGDDLTRGRVGGIEDWTGLHRWIKERPIKMTPGELPPEKDPIIWRSLIARSARTWFGVFGEVRLAVDWSGKLPRMTPAPANSLGTHLGVVMVDWIGRPLVNTRMCAHCGRRFRYRTNAIYCRICRTAGIPALDRKRKQRAEARRRQELLR